MAESISVGMGDAVFGARLEDNVSARAFAALLAEGPLTVDMHDYAGMEKVGDIGQKLPRADEQVTTAPGDIILYQGDRLTIYYDENTWSLTRLARIEATRDELFAALGTGSVTVTFALVV